MTTTTEHPILFVGSMVRAILEGRKSMTRRVVKPQPTKVGSSWVLEHKKTFQLTDGGLPMNKLTTNIESDIAEAMSSFRCPYGVPGHKLWVRETFSPCCCDQCVEYWPKQPPADSIGMIHTPLYEATYKGPSGTVWRPSIHIPRWACRLLLEVAAIRVERVQEISHEDAIAEGCEGYDWVASSPYFAGPHTDAGELPVEEFEKLWDSINAKRKGGIYAWDKNPWVWVVEFKRIEDAAP